MAAAQLNAGDVLAMVGGDVSRKPVLQCIGELREREKQRRETEKIKKAKRASRLKRWNERASEDDDDEKKKKQRTAIGNSRFVSLALLDYLFLPVALVLSSRSGKSFSLALSRREQGRMRVRESDRASERVEGERTERREAHFGFLSPGPAPCPSRFLFSHAPSPHPFAFSFTGEKKASLSDRAREKRGRPG